MDGSHRQSFLLRYQRTLCVFLLLVFEAAAQNAPVSCQTHYEQGPSSADESVAAAARNSKSKKETHAKKVFGDEDMEAWSGPLPRLKMEGTENADEIITAITAYRANHTAEQTERVVHLWYERYDEVLAAAIQNNIETRVLRDANTSNGYELCMESRDYQQCHDRQMAEQRGARNDQVQIAKNLNVESRIQQSFMRIRNALMTNNLRYAWFKVRTTNGVDKF
jgi:hypothetical protein